MNKKFISSLVTMALVFNVSVCFSAEKKDVTDPVLREMINSLSAKMPKFINQYGASVFVADEKITRGALIKALYEYDKKTSGGASLSAAAEVSEGAGLTKKQYAALSNRIAALERNSASTTGGKTKSASGSVDIVAVMNDLEPNMPMLLDNTLAQSKVFKDLQRKVALASAGGSSNSRDSGTFASDDSVLSKSDSRNMLALRKEIASLNKKIDNFELELAASGVATSNGKKDRSKNSKTKTSVADSNELEEMKAKLIQIQRSYVAMSKRVNELEANQQTLTANAYASPSGKGTSLSSAQMKNINLQIASIKKTVENIPTNDYVDAEIQKANMQTAKDIKRIEYRLNNLRRSGKFVETEPKESSSEGSSKTGTIAKISLGVTLIAALFIAR